MVPWNRMRIKQSIRVLGIETSCDETAAAVVEAASCKPQAAGRRIDFSFRVLSNVVASQVAIHAKYGGIVPEVAAREHVMDIIPVVKRALRGHRTEEIDAIAVTAGPGLVTSLSIGVETARSLAYAWEKPLIAVNHIEGHVLSALLPNPQRNPSHPPLTLRGEGSSLHFPALALIVSGGHTELLLMRGWRKYECVGATRDDAAGEAFDKVARILGLPYPGGPAVARAAERGNPAAFTFPRPMLDSDDFDFSFSGLKTAVRYLVEGSRFQRDLCKTPFASFRASRASREISQRCDRGLSAPLRFARDDRFCRGLQIPDSRFVRDVCASFQHAVVDVLIAKTVAAAKRYGARTVLLGGGVAANRQLRERLGTELRTRVSGICYLTPDASFTGDNAAMIAASGGIRLLSGEQTPWQTLEANANWELRR